MSTRFSLPVVLAFIAAFAATPRTLHARRQPQGQSQQQSPPAQQPATPQSQKDPPQEGSVADAARKSKTDKPKPATKKVFTDEDVSSLKGNTLSVVGEEPPAADPNADPNAPGAKEPAKPAAQPGPKDEAYWRAKAKKIRDQMAEVDQQIATLQDEIKKGGNLGVDPKTGLTQNVIILEDRSAKLKSLEKKRDDLQAQMDALEEEARRADVPVGWLR